MARISSYSVDGSVSLDDKLIGTDAENSNETKNFLISDILALPLPNVPVYANNADAIDGGLAENQVYRISGTDYLGVVHV
jgi:hypothetical protein